MKMPLQSNTAPSASRAQKAIAPSATSRREGAAKRGPRGGGSASAGGSPREATQPAAAPTATTIARCGSGSRPAEAARPPMRGAGERAEREGGVERVEDALAGARSTASPSTFIETSSAPLAAPTTSVASASVGRVTASAGAIAGSEQQRRRGHDPARADRRRQRPGQRLGEQQAERGAEQRQPERAGPEVELGPGCSAGASTTTRRPSR